MSIQRQPDNYNGSTLREPLLPGSNSSSEGVDRHGSQKPPSNPRQSAAVSKLSAAPLEQDSKNAKAVTQGEVGHLQEGQVKKKLPKEPGKMDKLSNWVSSKLGLTKKNYESAYLEMNKLIQVSENLKIIEKMGESPNEGNKQLKSHFSKFVNSSITLIKYYNPGISNEQLVREVNAEVAKESKRLSNECFSFGNKGDESSKKLVNQAAKEAYIGIK